MIITIDLDTLTTEQRAYLARQAAAMTTYAGIPGVQISIDAVVEGLLSVAIDAEIAQERRQAAAATLAAAQRLPEAERLAWAEQELRERGSIGGGQ